MNARLTLATLLVAGLTPGTGVAIELLQQGTFGSGFAPEPPAFGSNWNPNNMPPDDVYWLSATDGGGQWYNQFIGLNMRDSGKPHTATLADNGLFFAVTDTTIEGSSAVLGQRFTIPTNASGITISFDMFINDYSGQGPVGDELGARPPKSSQMARVDILDPLADPFSTSVTDVVASLLGPSADSALGSSGQDDPNEFRRETYSILLEGNSPLMAGNQYILRFGEADDFGVLNFGVDNVSIIAKIPEPGALALFLSGLGALSLSFRRRMSLQR
jgi:hypothetical protein